MGERLMGRWVDASIHTLRGLSSVFPISTHLSIFIEERICRERHFFSSLSAPHTCGRHFKSFREQMRRNMDTSIYRLFFLRTWVAVAVGGVFSLVRVRSCGPGGVWGLED